MLPAAQRRRMRSRSAPPPIERPKRGVKERENKMSMRLKGVSDTRGCIPADDPEVFVVKAYMKLAGLTRERVIRRRLIKTRLNQIRDFEARIREIDAEEATYRNSIETSLASGGKEPRDPEERETGSSRAKSLKGSPGRRRAGVEVRY